jgi:hypothetical protein
MNKRRFTNEAREEIDRTDLEKINASIEVLIRESQDLDDYQAPIDWECAESDCDSNSE